MKDIYNITADISATLKQLRKDKKISQQSLAGDIGVAQKTVDLWEKGICDPAATYVVRLAAYFDVSTDFLLGAKKNSGKQF